MIKGEDEFKIEHLFFHEMVPKRMKESANNLYWVLQSCMYLKFERADLGAYLTNVFPDGWRYLGPYCPPYSAEQLAYFNWLYEIRLPDDQGLGDYMNVTWTRRYDQRRLVLYMKINNRDTFVDDFDRELQKLDKKREKILIESRWDHGSPFDIK